MRKSVTGRRVIGLVSFVIPLAWFIYLLLNPLDTSTPPELTEMTIIAGIAFYLWYCLSLSYKMSMIRNETHSSGLASTIFLAVAIALYSIVYNPSGAFTSTLDTLFWASVAIYGLVDLVDFGIQKTCKL